MDRIRSHSTSRNLPAEKQTTQPITAQESFAQPAAEKLHESFNLACERDLRSNVSRMRLYLEDDRTVSVLVGHVIDRIMDEYAGFRDVVSSMYSGDLKGVLFSPTGLRERLKTICEEKGPESGSA